MSDLETLLNEIRACRHCADDLEDGPRPVIVADVRAKLLIVGQAPGTRVHETGIPWNDPSGDRLRLWMGLEREAFYDAERIAIMPMGLCYPGRDAAGGDKPPRRECAPLWHDKVLALLPRLELVLLVGRYAQQRYLGTSVKPTMGETVRAWREYGPDFWPLPHPSWRNTGWMHKNPWFTQDVLPALQGRVAECLN